MSWAAHRLGVALTAVTGFVAGHGVAYVAAYPSGSTRSAAMHATGHDYWGAATAVAVAAAFAALVSAGWRAATAGDVGIRFLPLAAGQALLFAFAEGAERLASGVPLAHLVEAPEFLAGLAAQVVVAAFAVWLLRRWGRLVEAVTARPRRFGAPRHAWCPTAPASPVVEALSGSPRTRAPPLLAAA